MEQEFVLYSADRILKLETLFATVVETKWHFESNMPSHISVDAVIDFCDMLLKDFKDEPEQG